MRIVKLYLETSVWNFYFADDAPEKKETTRDFFHNIERNNFEIFISDEVLREINCAVDAKREILVNLISEYQPQLIEIDDEMSSLAGNYISNGILPVHCHADALHAAAASVSELDALISWNMKHLANYRRMRSFNAINLLCGYNKHIDLITPMEVSIHED